MYSQEVSELLMRKHEGSADSQPRAAAPQPQQQQQRKKRTAPSLGPSAEAGFDDEIVKARRSAERDLRAAEADTRTAERELRTAERDLRSAEKESAEAWVRRLTGSFKLLALAALMMLAVYSNIS